MKKIIISFFISITITLIATSLIKKNFKNEWELQIRYDHIGATLNTNYEILEDIIDYNDSEQFSYFVENLDRNISVPGKLNSCSNIRSSSRLPNILITFEKSMFKVIIRDKNKDLINQCENYIDNEIFKYSEITKNKLKTFFSFKTYNNTLRLNDISETGKFIDLLKKIITSAEEQDSIKLNELERISTSLILYNFFVPKFEYSPYLKDNDIDEFIMVQKSFRNFNEIQINNKMIYFSFFIISFSGILTILNFKSLTKNRNSFNRNSFKKLIKKIF